MPLVNLREAAKAKLVGMLRAGDSGFTEMRPHIYRAGSGTPIEGVELVDDLAAGGHATAKIVRLSESGVQVTSEEIEVYDWKGMTGKAGKRGEVFFKGGRWWVIFIMAECP